jgi:hypothetical protein
MDLPIRQATKKGGQPIRLRVIEYTIEHPGKPQEQLTYRLITSLLDIEQFPAELLARNIISVGKLKTLLMN